MKEGKGPIPLTDSPRPMTGGGQQAEWLAEYWRLILIAFVLIGRWADLPWISHPTVTLATVIGCGWVFLQEAYHSTRRGRITMELTMSLALMATLWLGEWSTSLVITWFVLFAESIEARLVRGGRSALTALVEAVPSTVTVRREGKEAVIPLGEVRLGDTVIIQPGERIGVDGRVLHGQAWVNQMALTGESAPVEKSDGERVLAGTVIQEGLIEVCVESIGADTSYGKILEVLDQAQRRQAPIERLADRLAGWLTWCAIGGAVVTYVFTKNIHHSLSAFMVAGSCGVAAGTPLALLAAVGRSAREGVIVKGGNAVERLALVDTVVFDKTGTLTLGEPELVEIVSAPGQVSRDVLKWAATAEHHAEHHMAGAVMRKAVASGVEWAEYDDVSHIPGRGVTCRTEGHEVMVGNGHWLEKECGISLGALHRPDEANGQEGSWIYVARDRTVVGALKCVDQVRPESTAAVAELKRMECEVWLLSGDHEHIARKIGDQLGVDAAEGGLLPQAKVDRIKTLMAGGANVAMVGDGVNDAPALVEAHIGVAMGMGTDVAMESADVGLMTNDLMKLVDAIKISRRSWRVIMFNFGGTLVVDALGIGLAVGGWLTPVTATAIHVGSEIAFILNSGRLFRSSQRNVGPSTLRSAAALSNQQAVEERIPT